MDPNLSSPVPGDKEVEEEVLECDPNPGFCRDL